MGVCGSPPADAAPGPAAQVAEIHNTLDSMDYNLFSQSARFGLWSIDDEKWLESFQNSYNKHSSKILSEKFLGLSHENDGWIPKIIHHIWLGCKLPDHFEALRQVRASSPDEFPCYNIVTAFELGMGTSSRRIGLEMHPVG